MLLGHVHVIRLRKLVASVSWGLIARISVILKSATSTLGTRLDGKTAIVSLLWKNNKSIIGCGAIDAWSLLNLSTSRREFCCSYWLSGAWNSSLITHERDWLKAMRLLVIRIWSDCGAEIWWACSWARSVINRLLLNRIETGTTRTIVSVVWLRRS